MCTLAASHALIEPLRVSVLFLYLCGCPREEREGCSTCPRAPDASASLCASSSPLPPLLWACVRVFGDAGVCVCVCSSASLQFHQHAPSIPLPYSPPRTHAHVHAHGRALILSPPSSPSLCRLPLSPLLPSQSVHSTPTPFPLFPTAVSPPSRGVSGNRYTHANGTPSDASALLLYVRVRPSPFFFCSSPSHPALLPRGASSHSTEQKEAGRCHANG